MTDFTQYDWNVVYILSDLAIRKRTLNLTNRLKRELGYSQTEIGEHVGFTQGKVSKILRGNSSHRDLLIVLNFLENG